MVVIVDSAFRFPVTAVSADRLSKIRAELTFRTVGGDKFGFGESQEVCLFSVSDGYVTVPRRYGFERLPDLMLDGVDIRVSNGSFVDFCFDVEAERRWIDGTDDKTIATKQELIFRQNLAVRDFLEKLEQQNVIAQGGIFCAPCGSGKTVSVCKMLERLKLTTFVLVHKEFLLEQWRDRLIEFLGLNSNEIGIVRQSVCDFVGKKVVIGMVQSIAERQYPSELYCWPGVVISDEVHRLGAPVWHRAIKNFSSKIRIGLTATPIRRDGLQGVFTWEVGNVLTQMRGYQLVPQVYQIAYPVNLSESRYMSQDGSKLFLGRLISLLCNQVGLNNFLLNEIEKAVKAGRKVMLLSDRLKHLRMLKASFDERVAGRFISSFFIGGMTEAARYESAKADVIFCTTQMTKEGLDLVDVDTLFLVHPHVDVEQACGRVLRVSEDKKQPIVVDIVPTVPICIDFAKRRLALYRRLKFDIKQAI